MKILLLLFICLFTIGLTAQERLDFNKKFIQSEDRWVAFKPDSVGVYMFGFIYIDAAAGLTFDYEGTFSIANDGRFIPVIKERTTSIKSRLEPNNVAVAFIPESKFDELGIKKTPDWLKYYKNDENSIARLYKWGYMYNGWNECTKALEYLEKANTINPDHKGLRVELAFSYNCLEQYGKAITILEKAIVAEPLDAYIRKELVYALIHDEQLDKAIKIYKATLKDVPDKTYTSENAYNILGAYFRKENVKKFNDWLNESDIENDKRFGPYAKAMKEKLNK